MTDNHTEAPRTIPKYSAEYLALFETMRKITHHRKFGLSIIQIGQIASDLAKVWKDVGPLAARYRSSSELSPRQKEILLLVAQGYESEAIARHLFLSEHTVKTHLQRVRSMLGTRSRTHTVVRALQLNLICLGDIGDDNIV